MDIVFILDRSGSMAGLERSTINGFNKMLSMQKEDKGEVFVTTILFDHQVDVLYHDKPIHKVRYMNRDDYYVRGTTALLDTIGYAIERMIKKQKAGKTKQVMFVITTDGYENASTHYTYHQIQKMIKRQERKYDWKFVFLGANIDVYKEASKIGIKTERAIKYFNDEEGIDASFGSIGACVSNYRNGIEDDNWKEAINNDTRRRQSVFKKR